jgi:hypothetical protein
MPSTRSASLKQEYKVIKKMTNYPKHWDRVPQVSHFPPLGVGKSGKVYENEEKRVEKGVRPVAGRLRERRN